MTTNTKRLVLFDFDGVIVDSFAAAYETNRALSHGLSEDEYREMFSGNIYETFNKRHETHGTKSREGDFFKLYLPKLMNLPVFPGILDAITTLEKHYILIVVSSTISSPIREYLEQHGVADHFADVFGSDVHKSKVEKMNMVFRKYDTGPHDAAFITDTLGDLHEAAKVGVGAIAVTWGFHSRETLSSGRPFAIVDNPNELPDSIETYFKTPQ